MSAQLIAQDLAGRLGLRRRPRSWGGNCPACGYHGAFSVKASPGYARPSLYCANGCTRVQLEGEAQRVLMCSWTVRPEVTDRKAADDRERKQAAAARLFAGSAAISMNDPAGLYLRQRRVPTFAHSDALRFRADCSHPQGGQLRAMIARVVDVDGRPIAAHRTYLTAEGRKADVDPPKASLGPVWGGSVRLNGPAAHIVIAEGIETAASAGLLSGLPACAAISAGNMAAGLALPAEVRMVTIAADHDEPGQRAAADAAERWRAEGRAVRVMTPRERGQDWNDVLTAREMRHAG